ncbi:uncharacterized protein [Leptinotarsa decemlineata]|uniref:uncharacterized protein n=1 Tax=Leptinotarsa decemlineata TaxID=7539 RepID=UPI003D304FE6
MAEQFTFNEYADMHVFYGRAFCNAAEARRLYSEHFPNRTVPSRETFERVDRSLRETGTVLPKRGGEGAPRTVRTVVLEENILEAVADDPSMSIRNISEHFHTSKSTIHRIIREQLLHPFHIQKVHAMTPQDSPARLEYANWFMDRQREDMPFINRVLFTDEAGFSRDGVINSHNLHIWTEIILQYSKSISDCVFHRGKSLSESRTGQTMEIEDMKNQRAWDKPSLDQATSI